MPGAPIVIMGGCYARLDILDARSAVGCAGRVVVVVVVMIAVNASVSLLECGVCETLVRGLACRTGQPPARPSLERAPARARVIDFARPAAPPLRGRGATDGVRPRARCRLALL